MSDEQVKQFIKDNDIQSIQDIQNVLKDIFAETMQGMLEAEMDIHLGYEKRDNLHKATSNGRNGHSPKAVRSDYGPVDLDITRDRESEFETIWGSKYPLIVSSWRNNWSELFTFFNYPPQIRKIIYTTNIIESYHRQLRKVTKGKVICPTDDALLKNVLSV